MPEPSCSRFGVAARCSGLTAEPMFVLVALTALAAAELLWAIVAVDQDTNRGRKKSDSEDQAALCAAHTPSMKQRREGEKDLVK